MKKLLSIALVLAMVLSLSATISFAEGKKIVYWSMWNAAEPQGQVIQKAVDAYVAATGNEVDLQFKGRDGQRQGLEPALSAGQQVDLFDEDIDRVNGTWGKYLMNLEELSKAANYEETANAALTSAVRNVAGGELKSIPYQPFIFNLFYNKELVKNAGVEAIPATWPEFVAALEKIKESGVTPLTADDAYIEILYGYQLARYLGEEGVIKVVNEGLWAETPEVLKAAQDFEELAKKGLFSASIASAVWPTNQNGEFALGEAAMYLNGSWLPNEIRDLAGEEFQWGAAAYPAVEGGVDGIEAANFGAQVLAINKDSKVAEEAFEIIKYITKGEFDAMLSQESLGIPASTEVEEWPAQLADVKVMFPQISKRYSWGAGLLANNDMAPIIREQVQKLFGGTATAEEFVAALEAAAK